MVQTRFSRADLPVYLAVVCFFAGIFAGTIWVNRMGPELQEQLGTFGQAYLAQSAEGNAVFLARDGSFTALLLRRAALAVGLWLAGMSLLAVPGLCLSAGCLGFSVAFLVSCMTVQAGAGGLFLFLASIFPQCLFFLPVGVVLTIWAVAPEKKMHGGGFAVLLFLTAAGTAAELWLNPWFLRFFTAILK